METIKFPIVCMNFVKGIIRFIGREDKRIIIDFEIIKIVQNLMSKENIRN